MCRELPQIEQTTLPNDLVQVTLLVSVPHVGDCLLKFRKTHVVHGIDLSRSTADRRETAWQRLACDGNDVRLSPAPVADHRNALVADVLDTIRPDRELAGNSRMEQRQFTLLAVRKTHGHIG